MMEDPTHNHHVNGVLIIIATLVVGGLLWYIIASSGDSYTATPVDTDAGVVAGGEELYLNSEYGFSLRYDQLLTLMPVSQEDPWRSDSISPGARLLTLQLSRDQFPETNFSEAYVTVGVSSDEESLKNCLVATNGEVEESSGNPQYKLFTSNGAGAGNFYEVESRRWIKNNACFAMEKMIHSTNILNYDESQHIKEFDRSRVNGLLDRVITSLRFTK